MKGQEVLFSRKSDEWSTPDDLYQKLNSEFNFTLDAAASPENTMCERFYDVETDGLKQDWANETVFVNPPYSQIKKWVEKAVYEVGLWDVNRNCTVVMLLPSRTDTRWFNDYILPNSQFNRDSNLAWAAGVIDGEGCIFIRKSTDKRRKSAVYDLGLKVTMTDENTVKRLFDLFGVGHLTKVNKHNPKWKNGLSWVCRANMSKDVIQKLLPYLQTKYNQALLALDFENTFNQFYKEVPDNIQLERDRIFLLMKELKHLPSEMNNRCNVEVRFLKGRLKFKGAESSAPFPSMIVIFR